MAVTGRTDLGLAKKAVTVDHDPTSVPTDAPAGSLIIDAAGVHYVKTDNGSTTNVIRVGVVTKMIDHSWPGDSTDNREIDLLDEYDLIFIFREAGSTGSDHMAMAYAFRDEYGAFLESTSHAGAQHGSRSNVLFAWQGKMTGGDATKIKLGSAGTNLRGANVVSETYRLIGFKFAFMA